MMGRQLVVVGMLLLAIAIINTDGYNFGDILSFKTRCKAGVRYKHFAIYVGTGNPHGLPKTDDDEIYERLKGVPPKCVFSKLHMDEEPTVNNYLDGYTDPNTETTFQKGTDEEISQRIIETSQHCGDYGLLHNNCEHLATYVRYGYKIAMQDKLTGQGMCINNPRINTGALIEHLEERCSPDAAG